MVQRIILALILIFSGSFIYAQADSLEVAAVDTLALSQPVVDRLVIEDWVSNQLQARNLFRSFLDQPSPILNNLDLYRASYHAIGLNNPALSIQRHGFSQIPGIWSQGYYLQAYDAFYNQSTIEQSVSFDEAGYTQPVLVTDLQAGLGDYEYNFARLGLKKNQVFGFPGLYYSLDFLAQTGLWTGIDHDQTSMRHYLSAALGRFVIEAEYADWAVDASSQDLNPVWWQSSNFVIDHKLRQYYAAISSPWLDLSLLSVSEKAKAASLDQSNRSFQIKAEKSVQIAQHQLSASYEHMNTELDYSPQASFADRVYDDLLSAAYGYLGDKMSLSLQAGYYDFAHLRLEGDNSWNWLGMKLGVHGMKSGLENVPIDLINIYDPASYINPVNQYLDASVSGYIQADLVQGLDLSINGGQRFFRSSGISSTVAWEDEAALPFVDSRLALNRSFGKYQLVASQVLNWQAETELAASGYNYTDLPQFRLQSYLQLKRDMNNNNYLFGGLSFTGHSSYISSTQNGQEFAAAGILDIWAGVQISKLFELSVSFKNVLDSDIYGVYPIPQSLHASLRWFYLN